MLVFLSANKGAGNGGGGRPKYTKKNPPPHGWPRQFKSREEVFKKLGHPEGPKSPWKKVEAPSGYERWRHPEGYEIEKHPAQHGKPPHWKLQHEDGSGSWGGKQEFPCDE